MTVERLGCAHGLRSALAALWAHDVAWTAVVAVVVEVCSLITYVQRIPSAFDLVKRGFDNAFSTLLPWLRFELSSRREQLFWKWGELFLAVFGDP